jgi:hypothetical protein
MPRHPTTTFRLSPQTIARLAELSQWMELGRVPVLEIAVRRLHESEGKKQRGKTSENRSDGA